MRSRVTVLLALAVLGLVVVSASIATAVPMTYKDYVLADGPRYYWTWDEASGSALNYGAGGGGTLKPGSSSSRVTSTTNAAGLSLGPAASFNGTAYTQHWSTLRATTQEEFDSIKLTDGNYEAYVIEFWFKPLEAEANQVVSYTTQLSVSGTTKRYYSSPQLPWDYEQGDPKTRNWIELYTHTGSSGFPESVQSGRTANFVSGAQLADNTWYHVVWAYQNKGGNDTTNDRVQLWVNGVK